MDAERLEQYQQLAQRLGYGFSEWLLMEQAMSHSSYFHENPECQQSNERLEFLGDAVLELVVTQALFKQFDHANEGQLSRARSSLVNEMRLAEAARAIDLGQCLLLGKGEQNQGGMEKNSILSDAMEALIAAVYLDGGLEAAAEVVHRLLGPLDQAPVDRARRRDYKTRLQEQVQDQLRVTPRYRTVGEHGPDHDKTFSVDIEIDGKVLATGEGKSKKEAEQNAAKEGLKAWQAKMGGNGAA